MEIKFNDNTLNKLANAQLKSLAKTGEAVLTDLVQSQTIPMDNVGTLQNNSTFVDKSNISKGEISIRSNTPYARRLYYHPEYNFQHGYNANAGGRWFDPYLADGKKGKFVQETFAEMMRREIGG